MFGKAFLYFVIVLLHHIVPFLKIANNHDDRNNNDTNNDITKHKIYFG